EKALASLEDADFGLCFASGSAATTAVLNLLHAGDEVLTTMDVYGGTYRLFKSIYARYGIRFHFLNTNNTQQIIDHINEKTRMIWIESPTNPLLNILDIKKLAEAKSENVLLVVDNTFATPYFQRPITLGADIIVHSTTKYLGGHSDVVGGALLTNSKDVYDACKFYQNAAGAVPSPFDCFLIQRGLKTLEVRMIMHEKNATAMANFLQQHTAVEQVFYPGLGSHPNHRIASEQMTGYSGMVSFRLKDGLSACNRFFEKIKVFTLAESLGGVESLACYPFTMTHGAIPDAEKEKIGITKNLIRLSVGIESVEDLLADLDQALK
ncbi:cystathionine gamma-synthase, partial [candidate division KSB1 bacterium RBG_16_48_16]